MAEITTPTYTIRYATEHDIPEILAMIIELATYEKAADQVRATPEKLYNTLIFPTSADEKVGSKPGFAKTLLITPTSTSNKDSESVSVRAKPAGMALYFNNYSTWNASPGIYLEDLFVRPEYRGRGFGKALLQALARECTAMGWERLDWSVLKWNKPSIDFYVSEAVGAVRQEEWVGMRVDGVRLGRLAGESGEKGGSS